ncbi:MAG: hypothetical protein A2V93_02720 [Ignavibacteria bacterium RBG_16_34_14]|nr:MAG: hypothetical protein A2V93_02720 [Ignavibacteria bacterium RBG_16_34_14]
MKKVAFLSMDNLDGFVCYDHLTFEPLRNLGWQAEEISWRNPHIEWDRYDAVIVRSTWDYQSKPGKFSAVLEKINSVTHLENKLSIIKWNMNKNYLKDLQDKGIKIVNTVWEKAFIPQKFEYYFDFLDSDEIIIKPNISANAENTFRIKKDDSKNQLHIMEPVFSKREFMVQKFMKNIIDEGEYSLFYFGEEYSHSILKVPKEKDFRVQEEHGGKIFSINPDREMKRTAEEILNKVKPAPLYARIDLVKTQDNEFVLIELELIEPSLYFNLDDKSPHRFAGIFNEWMTLRLR